MIIKNLTALIFAAKKGDDNTVLCLVDKMSIKELKKVILKVIEEEVDEIVACIIREIDPHTLEKIINDFNKTSKEDGVAELLCLIREEEKNSEEEESREFAIKSVFSQYEEKELMLSLSLQLEAQLASTNVIGENNTSIANLVETD